MNTARYYSRISLTSLLDVVFNTLFIIILSVGNNYRSAAGELTQRGAAVEAAATTIWTHAQATTEAGLAVAAAQSTGVARQQTAASATMQAALAAAEANALFAQATATAVIATAAADQVAARATMTALVRQVEGQVAGAQATVAVAAVAGRQAAAAQATTTVLGAAAATQAVAARATLTAVALQQQMRATAAAATVTSAAGQQATIIQATTTAVQATAEAMVAEALETTTAALAQANQAAADAVATVTAVADAGQAAIVAQETAAAITVEEQSRYQELLQILADEAGSPGITIAKARWVDKYANFYQVNLSPQVEGRSTVEVFRNDKFLDGREVMTEEQIRDLLSILDRSDVADTLVILRFSRFSSDNHREWILRYLDTYNFKYQRIQEETE